MIVYDPTRTEPCWAPGSWNYLASIMPDDAQCFEWGGGISTLWLAQRAARVVSVESDAVWCRRIGDMTLNIPNVTLVHLRREWRGYVDEVDLFPDSDVFLIDGYRRIECLDKALEVIRPGGILVLDDALDYVGDWKPDGVKVFSMPHPYAGKKVMRNLWGNTHLKVGDLHHETKETWVYRVP